MIELQGVSKWYGEFRAVHNLDLTIGKGELFCFLGPNGAGKTTTIKMLCGLLHPSGGEIRLGGLDLHRNAVAIRQMTGYIPDTPYLYERLTCVEFFEFVGELYALPRDYVRKELNASIELFGLGEHRSSLIKDLSHGLRQRLVYASALLPDPKILFVDEPFIGLDPHSIRLIKELMREKTSQGMTVLLTTHILALAEDLADRIGIMSRGELAALGTLEEIQAQSCTEGRLEDVFMKVTEDHD